MDVRGAPAGVDAGVLIGGVGEDLAAPDETEVVDSKLSGGAGGYV